MASVYRNAISVKDSSGRKLQIFQVTTMERQPEGAERLGWALVAARDLGAAGRRARALWPGVVVLDIHKGAA